MKFVTEKYINVLLKFIRFFFIFNRTTAEFNYTLLTVCFYLFMLNTK